MFRVYRRDPRARGKWKQAGVCKSWRGALQDARQWSRSTRGGPVIIKHGDSIVFKTINGKETFLKLFDVWSEWTGK